MTDTLSVAIVRNPDDSVASTGPVAWSESQLVEALAAQGVRAVPCVTLAQAPADALRVVLSALSAPIALSALDRAGLRAANVAEETALVPAHESGQDITLASGSDPRGLVYAILELADRVRNAVGDPLAALRLDRAVLQHPANRVRGVARLFASDVEDLPWFHDRAFWRQYLSNLAAQRFNRIHLAFGMGHDFLRNVVDAYLLFAYPFLIEVPGFDVRVPGLSDEERARNLESLRFASDEAAARGLHFQLGVWTQAYAWVNSPRANYVIRGLNATNHAAYCRDAIRAVLQACPSIAGVTFRVHGESGVPEGNYDFWRAVFRGVADCGRTVELDLHPKGLGPEMLSVGLETGLPLTLSPKYTAEHMGLPGHQVAIRELERMPASDDERDAFREHLMNQSGAALRYTRYGHADFLREDRPYGVFYRIWPGTQRLLLWGDPAMAAGFGRFGSFCGSLGVEVCEPLSFKGRRGSGLPGGREGYADAECRLEGGADWEKFDITYRLFGRLLYDPDENPAVWRRALAHGFGTRAAEPIERALANASRVLPLVTSAYHPSAANNRYWPELYTNLPIVDERGAHPYRDTPSPKRFGAASPLDPGLFVGVDDFVSETLAGQPSGRVSPLNVAARLDRLADAATESLAQADRCVNDRHSPRFRRVAVDVAIQAELGRFFAAKLRAGVAFALYRASGARATLREALDAYDAARAAWCEVIEHGRVYRPDLTVGGEAWLRGHWSDRLAAIDADRADMQAEWDRLLDRNPDEAVGPIPPLTEFEPPPLDASFEHAAPAQFEAGRPLPITLRVNLPHERSLSRVDVHYRHVHQAETYIVAPMQASADGCFEATVPANYTDSSYPLQYFFVARRDSLGQRYPDLAPDLANQPYFVVRQRTPQTED
jgi:hypothetical protein